jgi:hypothetical protein
MAQEQQRQIILLLLQDGVCSKDKDTKGKTVEQAAVSPWILEILHGH